MPEPTDWEIETRHLRAWVNGGGTSTEPLRAELASWLVRMSNSPAEAVGYLADALAAHPFKGDTE